MPEAYLHRVTVTASVDGVQETLNEFEQFSQARGLPDDLRRRCLVALDEVLSNVVRHGQPADGLIRADFKLAGDQLAMIVEDEGPPFNPLEAKPADTCSPVDQRKPGGLGIELVKRLLEGLWYERAGARNRLTLTDRLSRHPDPS